MKQRKEQKWVEEKEPGPSQPTTIHERHDRPWYLSQTKQDQAGAVPVGVLVTFGSSH